MLTIDDFDKAEVTETRLGKRVIKMTPKEQVAGLDDLEISVFITSFTQGNSEIWGWQWSSGRGGYHTSLGKDHNPPITNYYNVHSAADAAIKCVNYWSDDERLPRDEKARQERERKQETEDNQIHRFLES